VIAAWVEATDIEVPISGQHKQVGLHHPPLPQTEATQETFFCGKARFLGTQDVLGVGIKVLVQADEAIAVSSAVNCLKPFLLRVPLLKPGTGVTLRQKQIRIFPQSQRQVGLGVTVLERDLPRLILPETSHRQVAGWVGFPKGMTIGTPKRTA
jgi:hypothetical protein